MRRWLPHIGIVLGLCIAAYALFWSSSDEDLIRDSLEQLERAAAVHGGATNPIVRLAKVRKQLSEIIIKDVRIRIAELTEVRQGRAELVRLAAAAPQMYRTADVDLDALRIEVDKAGQSAAAHGEATLTGTDAGGQPRRDTRTVMLRFDKIDGKWTMVSLSVSLPETDNE